MKLRAIHDRILCTEIEKGQQTLESGIILLDDDAESGGIRPRWMQVYAIGPAVSKDVVVGEWILVEHGRWSHGITLREDETDLTLWQAEETSILCTAKEKPPVERYTSTAK